jgi:hypothetical protein
MEGHHRPGGLVYPYRGSEEELIDRVNNSISEAQQTAITLEKAGDHKTAGAIKADAEYLKTQSMIQIHPPAF